MSDNQNDSPPKWDGSQFPWEPVEAWMFGDSVEARNALQQSGKVHPYTCRNNECREKTNQAPLRAIKSGWICDHCNEER